LAFVNPTIAKASWFLTMPAALLAR
jgi:hypothetical protein